MPTKLSDNDLLDRYISGNITAPQEAELEQRALTDPVLADAMAGLMAFPEADHEAGVTAMLNRARTQVRGGGKEARVRPLSRYAAVAAVLLLIATAIFLLPQFGTERAGDLAMKTEAAPPAVREQTPMPANDAKEDQEADVSPLPDAEPAVATPAPPLASAPPTPDPRPRPEPAAEPTTENLPEAGATEDMAMEMEAPVSAPVAAAPPPEPIVADRVTEINREETTRQQQAERARKEIQDSGAVFGGGGRKPNQITGRITNEKGDPVVGALVRLPGLPLGERTDTSGIFTLDVDATASLINISHPDFQNETLDVSLANLEDIQLTLETRAEDDYQWKQAWKPVTIPLNNAEPGYALPEEGYNALRKRIEAGKPDGVPAGKIKLSFLVDPDGTLSDFVFRGKPDQETMDYVGGVIARTSIWNVVKGKKPVRVYFKVVLK